MNNDSAELFLHDVERGDVEVEAGMTLRDYITRYAAREKNEQTVTDKLVGSICVNRSGWSRSRSRIVTKRIDHDGSNYACSTNKLRRFFAYRRIRHRRCLCY